MYFIDIEASSLSDQSYPIEIAWVDETGQSECYLIRPEYHWTEWSPQAEKIHHIPHAMLHSHGKPADFVARRAMAVLADQIIISDNPQWDQRWLAKVIATVYARELPMIDQKFALGAQISRLFALNKFEPNTLEWHQEDKFLRERGQSIVDGVIFDELIQPYKHRALPDAEFLWRCWNGVKKRVDAELA